MFSTSKILVPVCAALIGVFTAASASAEAYDGKIQVWFSPNGGVKQAVIDAARQAQKRVRVSIYKIESPEIAEALIDTARRGVSVEVVLDAKKMHSKASRKKELSEAGIPVYADSMHKTFHDKFMVVDGLRVATGSFNYKDSSDTSNAENLVLIDSPALAARYEADWEKHRNESVRYELK
ncbi:phospholipase D family protein [uncultured Sutterella sp.]|uniref:phospholipase D family nuclease n=1 Tax=uncultured Sutterella sp. TaxID=286133 RepID=UPI002623AFD1|nr:phospholipase D family protein [uncultured Sutterella sp.]